LACSVSLGRGNPPLSGCADASGWRVPAGAARVESRCADTSSSSPPSEQPDSPFCSLRPHPPDLESRSRRLRRPSPRGRRPPSSGVPAREHGARAVACAGSHRRGPRSLRPLPRARARSSAAAARPRRGGTWSPAVTPSSLLPTATARAREPITRGGSSHDPRLGRHHRHRHRLLQVGVAPPRRTSTSGPCTPRSTARSSNS